MNLSQIELVEECLFAKEMVQKEVEENKTCEEKMELEVEVDLDTLLKYMNNVNL